MSRLPVETALREVARELSSVSDRPRLEAEILLAHALRKDRIWLHTHSDAPLEPEEEERFRAFVGRRKRSEPIEYITGRVSFYDVVLEVGKGVLIARPETELLVDMAARVIEEHGVKRVCEIGVGSGAVSIMLARRFPRLSIVATDISDEALRYARKNVARYDLEERIRLVCTDLMAGVGEEIELVVSNPPYIKADYLLPHSVRYEPKEALIGGEKGDELLRRIVDACVKRGVPHLVCEMGYDQRAPIADYCRRRGLPEPRFYKDLAGLDRGFYLRTR